MPPAGAQEWYTREGGWRAAGNRQEGRMVGNDGAADATLRAPQDDIEVQSGAIEVHTGQGHCDGKKWARAEGRACAQREGAPLPRVRGSSSGTGMTGGGEVGAQRLAGWPAAA